MARARFKQRRNLTLGEFITQAREMAADEEFINFLKQVLPSFANEYAYDTKRIAERMGIRNTGKLIKSIYGRSITFVDGNAKVGIAFEDYGIYQNLGVGRGVTVTERQTGIGLTRSRQERGISTSREARPFLTESENRNSIKLENLLESEGAQFLENLLASQLSNTVRVIL